MSETVADKKPIIQRSRRRIYESFDDGEDTTSETQNSSVDLLESHEHRHEADAIVNRHIIAGMTVAVVPLPLFDLAALTLVQLRMLKQLSAHYDIPFSESKGTSFVSALIGSLAPISGGYMVLGSLFKSIPVFGYLIGGASLSCCAGAATYAVGKVFQQHFESGGTFLNFKPEAVEEYFKEQYDQGKLVARKKETESAN